MHAATAVAVVAVVVVAMMVAVAVCVRIRCGHTRLGPAPIPIQFQFFLEKPASISLLPIARHFSSEHPPVPRPPPCLPRPCPFSYPLPVTLRTGVVCTLAEKTYMQEQTWRYHSGWDQSTLQRPVRGSI